MLRVTIKEVKVYIVTDPEIEKTIRSIDMRFDPSTIIPFLPSHARSRHYEVVIGKERKERKDAID